MKDSLRLTIYPVTDKFERPIGYSWEIAIPTKGRDFIYSGCARPNEEILDTPYRAWEAAIKFAALLHQDNSFVSTTPAPKPMITEQIG
jgi:hypothetical protein